MSRKHSSVEQTGRCPVRPGRSLCSTRTLSSHSPGQWLGVHRQGRPKTALRDRREDLLLRAQEPFRAQEPWENGYNQSSEGCAAAGATLLGTNASAERPSALKQAEVLTEQRRHPYNTLRPHRTPGYRPQAPAAIEYHRVDLSRIPDGR